MQAGRGLRLSPRQSRVLGLHARGLIDKEIAAELGITVRTVRGHMQEAMARLGSRTRAEAVLEALRRSELSLEETGEGAPGTRSRPGPPSLPDDLY